MKIELTLEQLESLLASQRRLVVEKLLSVSYCYNPESTEGHLKTLPIDKEKFTQAGMNTTVPGDVLILKKYLKP